MGFPGQFGPTPENIDFGDGVGRGQQRFRGSEHLGQQGLEEFGFARQGLFVGTEDFAFLSAQLFRGEAFGVHHRLLADIVRRDGSEVGLGDFNRIPKRPIVADLERLDARARLFLPFEVGDPGLAVGRERTEPVEFGIEASPQSAPFREVDGQFLGQGRRQLRQQRALQGDALGAGLQGSAWEGRQLFLQQRQGLQRVLDAAQFTWVAEAVLEAGEDARDITDAFERFAEA